MSLKATVNMQLTVTDTTTGEFVDPNNATFTVSGLNSTTDLTGSTTPAASKQSAGRATMTAGAATIDLTSLPDKDGVAAQVTFATLKITAYKFINPSANANAITVTFGATNAYLLHGAAWKMILQPGDEGEFKLFAAPTVDATHKNIDIAGTGSQFLEFHFVAG